MTTFPGKIEDIWALPPKGITHSSVSLTGNTAHIWTNRCAADGCFCVAYSRVSEEDVKQLLSVHVCPQPEPRRGMIASGKNMAQKLWDEADDAIQAIKNNVPYNGLEGEALRGYAQGIAEAITFLTPPIWRVKTDVLKQLQKRWRMRVGEIPFEPTPGYSEYEHPELSKQRAIQYPYKVTPKEPVRAIGPKPVRAKVKVTKPAAPVEVTLSPEQRKLIRDSYHEDPTRAEALAAMFGVTVERITSVAGTKPKAEGSQSLFMIGGF